MSMSQSRTTAFAALVFALVAGPASSAPPASSGHTAKAATGTTTGRSGTGTTGQLASSHAGGSTAGGTDTIGAGNSILGNMTGGGTTTAGTGTSQTNTKAQAETAVSLLHDAHRMISSAHFSYEGHRATALKEIDRAVHELSPPKENTAPQTQTHLTTHTTTTHATGMTHAAAPAVQQTLAEADAKLQAAITLLGRAHERITNANAAEDVAAAITELKAALQVQ
jgi:hypothetical protein